MQKWLIFLCVLAMSACGVGKSGFSPSKKYPVETLQRDYDIYQHVLEESHPGLYWYQPKGSMDAYFNWGRQQIKDSLTEPEFRKILNYVTSKVDCGHTSVRSSKAYNKYLDTARITRLFPLSLKVWKDTAVITANLHRRDSILKRGTVITKLNGEPISQIADSLFNYISGDGYNTTHKFQALSNRGFFGSLYTYIYGNSNTYAVEYVDTLGRLQTTFIKPYYPAADTFGRVPIQPLNRVPQPTRKERKNIQRNSVRLLKIDSANHVAMLNLNSFSRGFGLQGFFRRSFKVLRKTKVDNLIIDVRSNSGGSPANSTLLSRFLADHKFKIGDSLYAISKRKEYGRYIKGNFFNHLFMNFFATRRSDGNYHLGYFERHYFKPRKKNHFYGKTYILTGGNSFSATTLFEIVLVDQDNITSIGEETGGGYYGNTAWQIPTVTLPATGVRMNLPLYRLVINKDNPKTGHGIVPEIDASPTVDAIRKRIDRPLQIALDLIEADKKNAGKRTN